MIYSLKKFGSGLAFGKPLDTKFQYQMEALEKEITCFKDKLYVRRNDFQRVDFTDNRRILESIII